VLSGSGSEDMGGYYGFVLTRLHARYGKDGAPNDLVFKKAGPIVGGREIRDDRQRLEERAKPDETNNFQGRYAIRHAWTGPITCDKPVRGRWGGPPDGSHIAEGTKAATNIAFAPRGKVALPNLVKQDVPEIGVKQGQPLPGGASFTGKPQGCGCNTNDAGGVAGGALLAGLGMLVLRRRRR
jgi:MYXO-CTERM domain-containing protein